MEVFNEYIGYRFTCMRGILYASDLHHTARMAATDPRETAEFILTVARMEYSKAVQEGIVLDAKIYQDIARPEAW